MKKLYRWYTKLPNRVKDSAAISVAAVGLISTFLSIIGISLGDWKGSSLWARIGVIIGAAVVTFFAAYAIIGKLFKNSVNLTIRHTPVSIGCGNIFEMEGWKIIGCDTHFDTRVDDVFISKKSLHGQLVLEHGKEKEIKAAVEAKAKTQGLQKNSDGMYTFPLGTIIRYNSSVDGKTYLMLAMTELNEEHKAYTSMSKFEHMLMRMWNEIDRVYASNDVVLPLLGTGISRFEDGPKDKESLLRCMLCTLNSSGVTLNSQVKVVIYGDVKDIPLYEYKNMIKMIPGR